MIIDAKQLDFKELNNKIRTSPKQVKLINCSGQRFICAGMSNKDIVIEGVPGNALGAYLDGANIVVQGNAQEAVGDTMNEGKIIIHGSIGDAAGYAMRGGAIYVKGDAGYRAGIHMKQYGAKIPKLVIYGRAGSFLGEYQAGGVIYVLGLTCPNKKIVGNFPCTGMHGGKMILRGNAMNVDVPKSVCKKIASNEEKAEIRKELIESCEIFEYDIDEIMQSDFTIITPDTKNPYKQMYVAN